MHFLHIVLNFIVQHLPNFHFHTLDVTGGGPGTATTPLDVTGGGPGA